MRTYARPFLATLLTVVLMQAPVMAEPAGTPSAPLGVILQTEHAVIGSGVAATGATVFAGDTLETNAGGTLRVRFGGSQAYLMPNSSATVNQASGGFGATLTAGTVIVSSVQGETFRLIADGATIRPNSKQATSAQITRVSPTELLLLSRKGALEVSMDDDVKTVPEGASYRMLIQPPDEAAGSPGSPRPQVATAGRNRFLFIALAVVAIGVTVGVILATRSPHRP